MKETNRGLAVETAEALSTSLVARMRRLAVEQVEFWIKFGPDRALGGFHGQLDRRGLPTGTGDKGLIQHARHLWSFSTWYERRESSTRIAEIAHSLYDYIVTNFSDPIGAGFFRTLNRYGQVLDAVHQVYPEAFAVYALCTYGRIFGIQGAVDRAVACFEEFDAQAYEPVHGGYDLTGDPPWQTPGASKETNTHIHVMEALTALAEVVNHELVHKRLREFTELTMTRLRQPSDYAHLEFLIDYTPFGDRVVSYGHDLEMSWLVTDALRVLNARQIVAPLPDTIEQLALAMGNASAVAGFDSDKGGYFSHGIPGQHAVDLEKLWWVQFEALPALVQLHLTGTLSDALHRLERTLNWLENFQADWEFGGVYWGILPNGSLGEYGDIKGDPWKASYHDLRALIFAADWLEDGTMNA